MNEIQYFKTIYSKFWISQTKKYGYGLYEQGLVKLILKSNPQKVFEVGIGTGWPIGTSLKEKGVAIDGCDLAENSIAMAQKALENDSGIWVGDVLEYKGSSLYDVTYCVRVSWCISDFYQTLKKMIAMTKPGGYIIFDVMDKNSICCLKLKWEILKEKYYAFLGIDVDKRYGTEFISLYKMKKFLKKNQLSYQYWSEREITKNTDKANTPKVVFCCRKGL